jgi:hypothetical protein
VPEGTISKRLGAGVSLYDSTGEICVGVNMTVLTVGGESVIVADWGLFGAVWLMTKVPIFPED